MNPQELVQKLNNEKCLTWNGNGTYRVAIWPRFMFIDDVWAAIDAGFMKFDKIIPGTFGHQDLIVLKLK